LLSMFSKLPDAKRMQPTHDRTSLEYDWWTKLTCW
jgi:hypothetical protein